MGEWWGRLGNWKWSLEVRDFGADVGNLLSTTRRKKKNTSISEWCSEEVVWEHNANQGDQIKLNVAWWGLAFK
jgi:hypothetical protein